MSVPRNIDRPDQNLDIKVKERLSCLLNGAPLIIWISKWSKTEAAFGHADSLPLHPPPRVNVPEGHVMHHGPVAPSGGERRNSRLEGRKETDP